MFYDCLGKTMLHDQKKCYGVICLEPSESNFAKINEIYSQFTIKDLLYERMRRANP